MQTGGFKELSEQVFSKDLCSTCGACVGICPYFKVHTGKVIPVFNCDLEKGRCYAQCPKTGIDFEKLSQNYFSQPYQENVLGTYIKIVTSKAGKNVNGGLFQNGGTVSALISFALENGTIEGAVLTDVEGLIPVPKIVENAGDVLKCASTKYAAAHTTSVVNEAAMQGRQNLGVVGTACQLTGVAQIRANPLEKTDFTDPVSFTIGLFCTWALDTRKILEYLSGKLDPATITGMDVPPPPAEVFVVKTNNGQTELPLSEVRTLIPNGCSVCPDLTAEWADLSVGAFEGKSEWNTLIIRTDKGEELVNQAVEAGFLILDEFPAESLEHLTLGAGNKKKRALKIMNQEVT
ncbi:Coenzyme F420 hydrogenase/dehydrogenase, beta subunit C-terminal domain [bacterium]|nr:Coenzyme F420 hydrogenase/dehydrogenase, beta subunit C-terminal domain [bacterium]